MNRERLAQVVVGLDSYISPKLLCALLILPALVAATSAGAANADSWFTIDESTLHMEVAGNPGEWALLYLPIAAATDRIDFSYGETYLNFTATSGGVYFPERFFCIADEPRTADNDTRLQLRPEWLGPGASVQHHYLPGGYGYCLGSDIRGILFVIGGTVTWSYDATYLFEDIAFSNPFVASGTGMKSWSKEIGTLQSFRPTLANFSVSTDSPGWLYAALDHDPIAQAFSEVHANAGTWEGTFPSGRATTRQFADAAVLSLNRVTSMGGLHEPPGTATMMVTMASADPEARILFAHIPHLLDGLPFKGANY